MRHNVKYQYKSIFFRKNVKALGPCRMPLHLCKVYKHNNPVYTCFLDASKAYDRVNH